MPSSAPRPATAATPTPPRRGPLAALVALALGLLAGPWAGPGARRARAQDDSEPGARRRIAVLLLSVAEVDPEVADSLSEVLIGAVAARGGMTILGREEFEAQLDAGETDTLSCVTSLACLGRVGVQLGVDEVIAGTIARREGVWVFNLNRVEVARGEVVGRVFREIAGDLGAVADALHAAVEEVYAPPPEPPPVEPPPPAAPPSGVLSLAAPADGAEVFLDGAVLGAIEGGRLERAGIEPGSHEVEVVAAGYALWARTVRVDPGATLHLDARLREAFDEHVHPLVWIAGAVAAASLATAIPLGVSSQETLALPLEARRQGTPRRAEALAFYEAREREAIAADVLYVLGGAAAVAAAVALFFPERTRRGLPERGGVRATGLGIEGWF